MTETFAEVLYGLQYYTDNGVEIKVTPGDEVLVIGKKDDLWCQVIRNAEESPFYVPHSYLKYIGIGCEDGQKEDENSNLTLNSLKTSNESITSESSKHSKNSNAKLGRKSEEFDMQRETQCLSLQNHVYESELSNENSDQDHDPFMLMMGRKRTSLKKDKYATSSDNSFTEDSMSPIYANLPLLKHPPTPKDSQKPLRKLSNDWLEFLDEDCNRKYYYNSLSGKTTWKPPRRHFNMQSAYAINKQSTSKSSISLDSIPNPPPKQLKPKLKKLSRGSSYETLEPKHSPPVFTILPHGYVQEYDSNGDVCFFNKITKKRWYSFVDENGSTYFWEKDSSDSVWELPNTTVSNDNEAVDPATYQTFPKSLLKENIKDSKAFSENSAVSNLLKKPPKLPTTYLRQVKSRSLIIPECVNLSGSEEIKGYLPPSFGEGYWPTVQNGQFLITRKGTLNKTKLVEGGKRIRKNWSSSFVILTDVLLVFYKDLKSSSLPTPGIKPELCIDLNGALIEWCPEKSSRKNVFQISTVLGQQLLLQDDNAQTTKEWFDTIHSAIMMLPSSIGQTEINSSAAVHDESVKKDIKLSRSKSTKHYSSAKFDDSLESDIVIPAEKKRKIRDKLRQFFVRRPTVESLREKGILLDEPVFGCHLQTLCARENKLIPKFVSKCIVVIEEKELTADGLYRASGNLSQVQKIRVNVNQDDYSCINEEEDVHVLTGALKMFFREMREPLFPFHMFEKFLKAIVLPDVISKLEAFKKLVMKMPGPNYATLKCLLQHLLKVTEYHKQNRMQIQNIAIVFGPTLMWPEQTSNNIALDMMHQNRIIEFLLLEFKALFVSESSQN